MFDVQRDTRDLEELLLQRLPECQPTTIRSLVATARVRDVRAGEHIYRQGESVSLTLILRGHIAFRRMTAEGQTVMTGVGSAGALFGFSSAAPVQSSVEGMALTASLVAQWPGSEIRSLARTDAALGLAGIDALAFALHAVIEQVEGYLHQDARRRVLRILARHRSLFFCDPAILNRAHLPGLVGTSREMTGRVLRELEREGTIQRIGRNGLRLIRPDRLAALPAEGV